MHFADLVVGAIGHRKVQPYVLWALLRDRAEPRGVGYADRDFVRQIGGQAGFSLRTLRRILKAGEDLFWTLSPAGRVYFRSPARVAGSLGITTFRAAFRTPIGTSIGTLAVGCVAALRQAGPTANRTTATMLKISERTWQNWRKRSGVKTISNYALVCPLSPTASVFAIARTTNQTGLRALRFRGRRWLVRQLPNSLPQVGVRGVRSHLRRQNRRLRLLRAGRPTSDDSGGGTARRRLFDTGRRRPDSDPSSPAYIIAGVPDRPRLGGRRPGVRLWRPVLPEERG